MQTAREHEMIKKMMQRVFVFALIAIIVISPFFLFRDNGRHAPVVLAVWLLLAVTYVYGRRRW